MRRYLVTRREDVGADERGQAERGGEEGGGVEEADRSSLHAVNRGDGRLEVDRGPLLSPDVELLRRARVLLVLPTDGWISRCG